VRNLAIFIIKISAHLLNELIFNSRVNLDWTKCKMVSNLGSFDGIVNLNSRLDFYLDCRFGSLLISVSARIFCFLNT
jgi:hypothetical protein